jgi:endonuclease-3
MRGRDDNSSSSVPPKKVRRSTPPDGSPPPPLRRRQPPRDWRDAYVLVEELRADRTAPCDGSGCEALALEAGTGDGSSSREHRFAALVSLLLSSQTKDAAVGDAIRAMRADGVLSVEKISKLPAEELNGYLRRVGFHNNKTKYLKDIVEILIERYGGDIPPTADEMMELPGIGPKMAYICENVAWDRVSGIGVDTHMHRLFNGLGWVQAKTPEQTRVQLESWLPREYWRDVNLLWVGFGQELQQFKPKILRKALDCSRPAEALRLLKRCGLDYVKEGAKLQLQDEIRSALATQDKTAGRA